ncbi:MAG: AhpC/TSA family protein [Candidatus Omnitrophica bacterium]|nr:AhpC/TSA family protein [Candidatus Omnitrophota bacterium]
MKSFYACGLAVLVLSSVCFAQEMPGLSVGVSAPDFVGSDFRGKNIQLSDYYKKGPVILIFYRGSWCPYCNTQLQKLQSHLNEFKQYQASLIAVSVDKIGPTAKMIEGHDLEFDIVSDPAGDILEKYGLVFTVPEDFVKKYKDEYLIDLQAASGRSDGVIAIPATYIIDTSGKIVFAYANKDYKIRTSPEEILAQLQKLK